MTNIIVKEGRETYEFNPEWIAAAQDFGRTYDRRLCKRLGFANWVEALQVAWHQGWDCNEPNGGLLRQLRNNYGHVWLRAQDPKAKFVPITATFTPEN